MENKPSLSESAKRDFSLFVVEDIWREPVQPPPMGSRPLGSAEQKEGERWLAEFDDLPDHLIVIVGVSYLDQALRRLLAGSMIDEPQTTTALLEDADALTLSTRIQLARCFGLISGPAAQMLHRLRKIRNTFAHEARPLTFDDPLVKDRAQSLPITCIAESLGEPTARNRFIGLLLSLELVLKVRWQRSVNAVPAEISLMECEFLDKNERREMGLLNNRSDERDEAS